MKKLKPNARFSTANKASAVLGGQPAQGFTWAAAWGMQAPGPRAQVPVPAPRHSGALPQPGAGIAGGNTAFRSSLSISKDQQADSGLYVIHSWEMDTAAVFWSGFCKANQGEEGLELQPSAKCCFSEPSYCAQKNT